ncbi:MAG: glycosyltransferase family 4 protein, partial [Bacteroidota bacterium]
MSYKIAYLTSKDPSDKKESSGVYYYQSHALEKHCGEVFHLGPANSYIINFIIKVSRLLKRFSKKKYNSDHSIIVSKVYARIFSKKLKKGDYDFIYADKSSCEIAFLKTRIPLIYSTDATFGLLHDYYQEYSNLFGFSRRESNLIEKNAIQRSSIIISTSQWAASSVMNDYHYPKERIFVRPRGANLDKVPDREIIFNKKKTEICRLLFIG